MREFDQKSGCEGWREGREREGGVGSGGLNFGKLDLWEIVQKLLNATKYCFWS